MLISLPLYLIFQVLNQSNILVLDHKLILATNQIMKFYQNHGNSESKTSHNPASVNIGKLSVYIQQIIVLDQIRIFLPLKTPTFFLSREEKSALHEEAFPHPKRTPKNPQQKPQKLR